MLLGRYRFCCRFDQESDLPADKSAALGSVFRRALKQAACNSDHDTCRVCNTREGCAFVQAFSSASEENAVRDDDQDRRPYPFVIQPPKGLNTHYSAGSAVPFHLLLFGDINRHLASFIEAFKHLGCHGLMPGQGREPARFYLRQVLYKGQVVYHHTRSNLYAFPVPERIGLDAFDTPQGGIDQVRITLQSPLWLKLPSRFKPDLPFHTLVRALLARAKALLRHYDGGSPDLDERPLLQQARRARIVERNLRLTARTSDAHLRFQDKSPYLVGDVTYQGPLDKFWPLIQFGVHTHIGRQAAFGLGRIVAQAL